METKGPKYSEQSLGIKGNAGENIISALKLYLQLHSNKTSMVLAQIRTKDQQSRG